MLELEDGTEKVCHCIWCGNRCIIVMDKNQEGNQKLFCCVCFKELCCSTWEYFCDCCQDRTLQKDGKDK